MSKKHLLLFIYNLWRRVRDMEIYWLDDQEQDDVTSNNDETNYQTNYSSFNI